MIKTIIYKELLEIFRDGRFRWLFLIILSLLFTALGAGYLHYKEISTQHEVARKITREHWIKQPDKNPHSAAHYGIYAFKPKLPLSFVDNGIDPYVGVAVWLEAHKQNDFKYRPAQDTTAMQRFGELTASTILQILMPLLIILLTFSAFVGEREQGTLKQLLSLGISKEKLIFGKALAVSTALLILLLPTTLIGVITLFLVSNASVLVTNFSRLFFLLGGYLAYFVVFILISLFISTKASSARTALSILISFWVINSFLIPKLAVDISKTFYPTPSAFEFNKKIANEIEKGIDGHNPQDKRNELLKVEILQKYNVATLEELPINFDAILLQEGEEYSNKVFDRNYTSLWQIFQKQNFIQQICGVFSPLLIVRSFSMAMAGTDFSQHQDFAISAENYRRLLVKEMNTYMANNSKSGDWEYKAGADLWQKVPEFTYSCPPIRQVLRLQYQNISMLLVWLFISSCLLIINIKNIKI